MYILCIKLNYFLFTMNKQTSIVTCDETNADNKVRLVARIKWQFEKRGSSSLPSNINRD